MCSNRIRTGLALGLALSCLAGEAVQAQRRARPSRGGASAPSERTTSVSPTPPPPAAPHPGPTQQYEPSARSRITSGADKRRLRRQPPGYGSLYGWDDAYYVDDGWSSQEDYDDGRYDPRGTERMRGSGATETPTAHDLHIPAGLTGTERTPEGGQRAGLGAFGGGALPEPPPTAVRVEVNGRPWYRDGTTYFKPFMLGGQVVYYQVEAPPGAQLEALPEGYQTVEVKGSTFFTHEGVYYQKSGEHFVVVSDPTPADTAGADEGGHPLAAGPDPLKLLRKMATHLGTLTRFSVAGVDTREEVLENGQTVQLSNWRDIYVHRPRRLFADVRGDELNRTFSFDGQTVRVVDPERNLFAKTDLPGTLDHMLDEMAARYDMNLPLADLLHGELGDRIEKVATNGRHVGWHPVDGQMCHHLVFSTDLVDWEIWVQATGQPLPRRLAITYKTFAGTPRYVATLSRWNTEGNFRDDVFTQALPDGATEIEILPVAEPPVTDKD